MQKSSRIPTALLPQTMISSLNQNYFHSNHTTRNEQNLVKWKGKKIAHWSNDDGMQIRKKPVCTVIASDLSRR